MKVQFRTEADEVCSGILKGHNGETFQVEYKGEIINIGIDQLVTVQGSAYTAAQHKLAIAQAKVDKLRYEIKNADKDIKAYMKLISGDRVASYRAQHEIKISTHTPDKWVMLDLENGRFYRWDIRRMTWSKPPKRAATVIRKILKEIKQEYR